MHKIFLGVIPTIGMVQKLAMQLNRIHWSLTSLNLVVPMRGRAVVKMKARIMQILIPVI